MIRFKEWWLENGKWSIKKRESSGGFSGIYMPLVNTS